MSTTTPVTSKSDLLAKIEHGYVASRAVLEALPAERWDEALPAGWTLKEMVGHLAYWEDTVPPFVESLRTRRRARVRRDRRRAEREGRGVRQGLSRDDVLKRWHDAHARVTEMVRSLNDDELADERIIEKLAGDTFDHYPDHFARPRRRHQDREGPRDGRERGLDQLPAGADVARPGGPRRDDIDRMDVQGARAARRPAGRTSR